jgi:hypothetical protein
MFLLLYTGDLFGDTRAEHVCDQGGFAAESVIHEPV